MLLESLNKQSCSHVHPSDAWDSLPCTYGRLQYWSWNIPILPSPIFHSGLLSSLGDGGYLWFYHYHLPKIVWTGSVMVGCVVTSGGRPGTSVLFWYELSVYGSYIPWTIWESFGHFVFIIYLYVILALKCIFLYKRTCTYLLSRFHGILCCVFFFRRCPNFFLLSW